VLARAKAPASAARGHAGCWQRGGQGDRLLRSAEYPRVTGTRDRCAPAGVGGAAPPHPRAAQRRRDRRRGKLLAAVPKPKTEPIRAARLPALHAVRAQGLGRRRARLQRTRHRVERHRTGRWRSRRGRRAGPNWTSDRRERTMALKPWREIAVPTKTCSRARSSRPSSRPTCRVCTQAPPRRVPEPGAVLPAHLHHRGHAPAAGLRWSAAQRQGRRPGDPAADGVRRRQDAHDAGGLPPRQGRGAASDLPGVPAARS
jgi:hypothetical protein